MTIEEALKSGSEDIRLTNGRKWMIWNLDSKSWEVYQQYRGVKMLGSSEYVSIALTILMKD